MTINKTHHTKHNSTLFTSGSPDKISLRRSVSDPDSGSKSNIIVDQQNIDDLTLQLHKQSFFDRVSPETTKMSNVFFQPIRNQSTYAVDHRLSADMQKLTQTKRKQMGKLERTEKPGFGLGGGILISEMHMLVTKHCFGTAELDCFTVQFEHLNSNIYKIEAKLSVEEAQELGLKTGKNGDLMIVRLAAHEQGYPGQNNNFTPLVEPRNKKPAKLHFMGYTAGKSLKESTMPGRPISITEIVKRGVDVSGQHATWNDFKTHGDIVKQTPEKSHTKFSIQSPARSHNWIVEGDTVYRDNGTIANSVNECYVLYPNIFSRDHVRLAHRTKGGSSGGIYFTDDGEIFAVHCGRLPSKKYYPEHIAFYPWTTITTTLYDDRLIYETKPITVSDMLKNHLKTLKEKQYCLSCADKTIGTIMSVKTVAEGYNFTIQPTDAGESFSFIIPFDQSAEVAVKDTAYCRAQVTFTFNPNFTKEQIVSKPSPVLYRVTLSELEAGNATHEIPSNNQKEFASRLNNNKYKYSMTHNKIRYEHITIGESQQKGTHYEFVREMGDVIAIHAIGTHRSTDTYTISQVSETFKTAATEKGLWVSENTKSQPLPIFKLTR